MIREIITIDEDLCDGCGDCVPNCPEGALQIIDGKVRLVGELLCDGLGACVGRCPQNAMVIEKREAEPYDEAKVMSNIVPKGVNTILAHLSHLRNSGAIDYFREALEYIETTDFGGKTEVLSRMPEIDGSADTGGATHHEAAGQGSALTHWPVQLHLINVGSSHFQACDLLLAADCTAFAFGGFHSQLLSSRKLAIACPKLDDSAEAYVEKLTALIDRARINTLTVAIMEVPCCGGLVRTAQMAAERAERKVPIKRVVVGVSGEIVDENWL